MIGIVIVVIGLLLMLFVSFWGGLVILILGLFLMAWPGAPYGYNHYRRRPPP